RDILPTQAFAVELNPKPEPVNLIKTRLSAKKSITSFQHAVIEMGTIKAFSRESRSFFIQIDKKRSCSYFYTLKNSTLDGNHP
ncbi:MAG: hypothetical protein P3W98_011385, partial [Vibrio metschnikovii]